jgi:two-component system response regulator GlrR
VLSLPLSCSVLLVDDDPAARGLLGRLLTGMGFTVQTAANGHVALAAIAADPPDLIISDIQMPHLDGLGLVQEVRRLGQTIPIVLISADPEAVRLPPNVPFLPKPVDLTRLAELLDTCLAGKSSPPVTD